jgi:hypothetical protein
MTTRKLFPDKGSHITIEESRLTSTLFITDVHHGLLRKKEERKERSA